MKASSPKAHHYVPRLWLAGFTETSKGKDRLWQTDLRSGKQWLSTPENAGHRRDFYRISDPQSDPLVVERKLSDIEGTIAPLFRCLDKERRGPNHDELGSLLVFMAVQWIRVPAFRPTILGITDSIMRSNFSDALRSPDAWEQTLRDAGIPAGSPGSDYQTMREFIHSGDYSLEVNNDWYLKTGFTAAIDIISSLEKRSWGVGISNSGDFIASDNPVGLDGPAGGKVGFENAEVIIYTVSRHVVIYGTWAPIRKPAMTSLEVARHNTFTMLTASDYVYSHRPDFCWLDEKEECQTDWRLFSKDRFR